MQGIETEPQKKPDPQPEPRRDGVPSTTHRDEPRSFSPDPMSETDRYRLVTPYELLK